MSLVIGIKGPEGIVLATESRRVVLESDDVTIGQRYAVHDDAVKLFAFPAPHDTLAMACYGNCLSPSETGAEVLSEVTAALPPERCSVATAAQILAAAYTAHARQATEPYRMLALVGGFDAEEPKGRLYLVDAPGYHAVSEVLPGGGMIWGGQRAILDRLIGGYDPNLRDALAGQDEYPLQFPLDRLSLEESAELATTLLLTTVCLQRFTTSLNACGGTVHVATITAAGTQRRAYPMQPGDGTYTVSAPVYRAVTPASLMRPATYTRHHVLTAENEA